MKKQPGNEQDWQKNDDDDDIIWVSKSEIKRDAEALKVLGQELISLGRQALARVPLDDELRAEIELAKKIKKEGLRRQVQFIGKMLRSRDVEPIITALDKMKNRHNQQIALFHKFEHIRDRLIENGDADLQLVLNDFPNADRQHLRNLVRSAVKERAESKPPKAYREIFQYLKELAEQRDLPENADLDEADTETDH
ncbi:MAG: ribosome biogenesis factor YjgA [Plesiomonas sp.]|uniref:ribosome biogenesis factor YjgA n=1 Tax=Plesiomonas sp. TaxID=2486279 RepID=UPI003EE5DD00